MRVIVNTDLCEGNRFCQELAPEIFTVDENDLARVAEGEVPPELAQAVREAVDRCPRNALSIAE